MRIKTLLLVLLTLLLSNCAHTPKKFDPVDTCRVMGPQSGYPLGGLQCSMSDGTRKFFKLDDPTMPDQVCIPRVQFTSFDKTCRE